MISLILFTTRNEQTTPNFRTEQVNEHGREPILNVIKAIGHWPMVQGKSWDDSKWEWKDAILKLRKYISKKDDDIFSGKEIVNEIDTVSVFKMTFE